MNYSTKCKTSSFDAGRRVCRFGGLSMIPVLIFGLCTLVILNNWELACEILQIGKRY